MTTQGDLRERDHYALLSVERGASTQEIRAAHARRIRQWHPDRAAITGLDPDEAGRRSQLLNVARDELLDPARRAAYDARLARRERLQSDARAEQLRRQQERRDQEREARPRPQRGSDVEMLHVLRRRDEVVTLSSAYGLQYRLTEPGRYKVPHCGNAGRDGGPAGDLFVTLRRSPELERAAQRRERRRLQRPPSRAPSLKAGEVVVAMLWGAIFAMLLVVALAVLADAVLP